jgi:hypothetical protein
MPDAATLSRHMEVDAMSAGVRDVVGEGRTGSPLPLYPFQNESRCKLVPDEPVTRPRR